MKMGTFVSQTGARLLRMWTNAKEKRAYRGSPSRQQLFCLRNIRHLVSRRVVSARAPPRAVTFVVVVDDDEGDDDGSNAKVNSFLTNSSLRYYFYILGSVRHLFHEIMSDILL